MENLSSIKNFFKSNQIPLSDMWLEGCLHWIQEENTNIRFTEKDLQLKVYEQWLLLDLRDAEMPCLPPNLNSQVKYVLEGNYSLQLLFIIDISKPKYMQLQKIRNSSVGEQSKEEKVASNRVLQLTLTDGVQEIVATEYKHIPCLNINLTPGIKIRILGPVTVRRGRMMLEDKNIKILGGEVEELLVPNAAENILAKALCLEINPNPKIIEETFEIADKDIFNKEPSNKASIIEIAKTNLRGDNKVINKHLKPQVLTIELDKSTKKIEAEIKSEQFCNVRQTLNKTVESYDECKKCKSPDLFEDDFDSYDFDKIEEMITPTEKLDSTEPPPKFYHINEITAKGRTYGIFKIKAKFKSVKEKLFISDGKFSLKLAIEDGTGELVVSVHPDLLLSLSGRSASVIENLNKGVVDKAIVIQGRLHKAQLSIWLANDDVSQSNLFSINDKILMSHFFLLPTAHRTYILMDLGMKIRDLNCAMDIEYKAEDDYPTIVKLYN